MTAAHDITTAKPRATHVWARDSHDWYVEPEWCNDRLFEVERFEGEVKDPACGSGRIVLAAARAGYLARGTDLVNRGCGLGNVDFLETRSRADNIVSNPPYRIARKFVDHALALAERKVAMLLPYNWLYGDRRWRWLETTPLRRVYILAPRPPMPPGHVIAAGTKPSGGRVRLRVVRLAARLRRKT